MARLGATDKRKDATGAIDFRLGRQFRSYTRLDDPPNRVKPIPVIVLRTVVAMTDANSASACAIRDMIILAFFFLLRPGEYTGSNNDDTPFRLVDVTITQGDRHLDLLHASDADLLAGSGVSLTFTTQKNGVRGEVVHHGRSGDPTLCPVLAVARRILHLRGRRATLDSILATFHDGRRFKAVQAKDITAALRAATSIIGSDYNFAPSDVSARSLRAGGAMALFNSNVDSDTIRLLGRWQSDAMLRYLHLQAKPAMRGFSTRMLQGGNYSFLPNQTVPDLVPVY